jgi:hypothetical protein
MKTLFKVLSIAIIGVYIFFIGVDLIYFGNLSLNRELTLFRETFWLTLGISLNEHDFLGEAERNIQIAQSPEFSKAVKQLASNKLESRINGINALEDIAKDSKNRQPVIEALTTFVKKNSSADVFYKSNPQAYKSNPQKISPDIQAILNVLSIICLRNKTDEINAEIDLARTHLVGVNLNKACISGQFYFIGTNLSNADLSGADISGADFAIANLSGANLSGANLGLSNIYSEGYIQKFRFGKTLLLKYTNLPSANLSGV